MSALGNENDEMFVVEYMVMAPDSTYRGFEEELFYNYAQACRRYKAMWTVYGKQTLSDPAQKVRFLRVANGRRYDISVQCQREGRLFPSIVDLDEEVRELKRRFDAMMGPAWQDDAYMSPRTRGRRIDPEEAAAVDLFGQ